MLNRTITRMAAIAATATLGASMLLVSSPASAHPAVNNSGTTSLQAAFTTDGDQFDSSWNDFDIATELTAAVLAAKPGSQLSVVTNGQVPLTAFVPNDRAFRKFVKDLSGHKPATEAAAYNAILDRAGIDKVERLLLSQIVPNVTLRARNLRHMNGAILGTMGGSAIKVRVLRHRMARIVIVDRDRNDQNAWLVFFKRNINKGNRQIAQGVDRVIRPVDL